MDASFEELKKIMDIQYAVKEKNGKSMADFHVSIKDLLSKNGIKLRQKDGTRPKFTFSISSSNPAIFVIGVRYTKLNETKTEDHFIFEKNKAIVRCYGKKLEKLLPEYKGTHKLQM
jgi:hypothetical protein